MKQEKINAGFCLRIIPRCVCILTLQENQHDANVMEKKREEVPDKEVKERYLNTKEEIKIK